MRKTKERPREATGRDSYVQAPSLDPLLSASRTKAANSCCVGHTLRGLAPERACHGRPLVNREAGQLASTAGAPRGGLPCSSHTAAGPLRWPDLSPGTAERVRNPRGHCLLPSRLRAPAHVGNSLPARFISLMDVKADPRTVPHTPCNPTPPTSAAQKAQCCPGIFKHPSGKATWHFLPFPPQ